MLFRSLQGLLQDIQQIAWRNLLLWLWKGMRKLPNEVWVLLKVLVVSVWLLCFLLSEDAWLSHFLDARLNHILMISSVQHLDLNRLRNDTSTQSTQVRDKC